MQEVLGNAEKVHKASRYLSLCIPAQDDEGLRDCMVVKTAVKRVGHLMTTVSVNI